MSATVHQCSLRVTAACGGQRTGKPTTKRCRACGGAWVTFAGTHGVFAWRGDGRYRLSEAVATFDRLSSAERMVAQDTTGTLVVRFITDRAL